jgi:serine/threonine protein kinase
MRSKPFSLADLAASFPDLSDFSYLDSGSFKAVYQVKTKTDTSEVIKLVRLPHNDGSPQLEKIRNEELGRLKREISLLGDLDCPLIVNLGSFPPMRVTIGAEECVAYSEELLQGKDLKAVITEGNKPTEEEIRVLLRCLVEAIQALWKQKHTVHRDIKPANIFATGGEDRPFVILDLGIAYNVLEPGLTLDPNSIPATPLYMAPEMLDPNFRDSLSYRADLYAAGLTVFEFASAGTHALAKKGDDYARTITRVLHQEPTRLKDLRPDISPKLTSLIDQLIRKKPSLRPGNLPLILKQLS